MQLISYGSTEAEVAQLLGPPGVSFKFARRESYRTHAFYLNFNISVEYNDQGVIAKKYQPLTLR